jgi:ribosomal protein S18 acetylase RimI-like enzyme
MTTAGMRPPRPEEAPKVAAMQSAHAPEPLDVLWVEREWSEPGFDLTADARMTDEAYIAVWDGRGGKAWIDTLGRPTAELLSWAEARAREKRLVRAFGGGWAGDEDMLALFERGGYHPVRHFFRMQILLADVSEPPSWPEGISVRTFRPGDERTFYDVHQETFADHWEHEVPDPYEEWAHWLLQPPMYEPDLWFLAEDGGEPAGVAICHRRHEAAGFGRVDILGVRRPWRRRGLGRALMLHAFAEFKGGGLTDADLGVDASSVTGANRLYESVGMRVAARRDTYEKHLP